MVSGGSALRGVFVAVFVFWYSTGIFKAMDNHFGSQFGRYLRQQLRDNAHMRRDVEQERQAMSRVLEARGKVMPHHQDHDVDHGVDHDVVPGADWAGDTGPKSAAAEQTQEDLTCSASCPTLCPAPGMAAQRQYLKSGTAHRPQPQSHGTAWFAAPPEHCEVPPPSPHGQSEGHPEGPANTLRAPHTQG